MTPTPSKTPHRFWRFTPHVVIVALLFSILAFVLTVHQWISTHASIADSIKFHAESIRDAARQDDIGPGSERRLEEIVRRLDRLAKAIE